MNDDRPQYTVPVPDELVETIEYNLSDRLVTAVLDLIAEHPSSEAKAALVAAARLVNPDAMITDDGIEVAPDDCFADGIAYPEHDSSGYDPAICRRCGAEIPSPVEQQLFADERARAWCAPEPVPAQADTAVCRNAHGTGFDVHDFDDRPNCRRCDLPRADLDGYPWVDAHGRKISVGDTVRQTNVPPDRGSLYTNVRTDGIVVGFGRKRVNVDFHRGYTGVIGNAKPIIDRIAPDLLVVQDPKE